jgi:3-phosphoshikimate 1-carboxyvinyltransferase
MKVNISPTTIKGTVIAPASKSLMQRACAAALLRSGETTIVNYGKSDDDKVALNIIQQLGATVSYIDEHSLKVISDGQIKIKPGSVLDCGESGLSLRMFTPIATLSDTEFSIAVKGSLANRPVHFFKEVLPQLGVTVTDISNSQLNIKGPLQPRDIRIDGSLTSQFLTGLLFAYSAAKNDEVAIEALSLKSKPYVDLTLRVMEDFGLEVPLHNDYSKFIFQRKEVEHKKSNPLKFEVEGDWSNAAFLMVAGAIAGSVTVKGLDVFTAQGDKKVLEALQDCVCRLSIQAHQIEVSHQPLKAFHFDATDCPDLFPPLAVLAACAKGTSVIEGVERLLHKESNRALTLQQEFAKFGVAIDIQDNKMIIKGCESLKVATVSSHNDHRIAMASALLALKAEGEVTINDAEAVNKSYPDFYKDLEKLCVAQGSVQQQ